ncbi:putative bifunctional diguanylate cyclase/phosphodiesterase [Rhodoferax sp.]|uniref:putative bifunctional diguanylate cyclase/phosphodiesterase n=1 Tax=Rhodoferax sp. TaxID=50421 RepID=UPI00374DE2AB
MISKAVNAWRATGTSTRLFLPIFLLIVPFSATKYYLLMNAAATTAKEQIALELPQVQRYLRPLLIEAVGQGDNARLQTIIDTELQSNPHLAAIQWQSGALHLQAHAPTALPAQYPAWFGSLVDIAPHSASLVLNAPNTEPGELRLQSNLVASVNDVWRVIAAQFWVTGMNVFTVFFLLGLILRATNRMLRRMAGATEQFKKGQHGTRIAVTGTREARALAEVFNGMAAEVQGLVQTLQQTQAALRSEKERADVTLASIGDAVITTDLAGHVETINAVAQQLTGWTREQAQGRPLEEVFELLDENSWSTSLEAPPPLCQTDTVLHASNQILLHPSGERFAIEYTAAPIRQADGKAVGCVLVFRDVSEKRQLIQEISWQIGHDVLTGLHNRAAMQEPFSLAILQARHHHKLLAVCLLDLDHFQPINDHYGSVYGDRLLQKVATRLAAFAGDDHGLARLGGDEFVLLMKNQSDLAEIQQQVLRVQAELSAPYMVDNQAINLTASIGIAVYPRDAAEAETQVEANLDTLLRHADQAMYQAKQTGRNRFHVFDAQHDQEVQTHHDQRSRVAQALHAGELRLYYQPKVNMRSGKVFGMEALLRWQHPDKGIVGPYQFLPLVENTDLIIDIGEWVLQEALQQMQQWSALGHDWVVSVNIAARHFQRADFVPRLAEILARFPLVSPRMLELEILESAALEDVQHMRNVMASCQQLGVQFALDDFGTGYSSLAYLKRLPANTLKIDQSFVRDMLEDPDDLTLVDAVVGMAKAFQRQVIAEGVETIAHGVLLLQLGCDLAQGYGIARPMPAGSVADWAARYVPPEAWRVWGAVAWVQEDFPLLLAEHDHHIWVAGIAAQPADADSSYPPRFGNWYAQRGRSLYGHLPAFTAVGTAIVRLRDHSLELSRLLAEGLTDAYASSVQQLQSLQAALAAELENLLLEATQKQAQRRAAQNFMFYS